MEDSRAKRIKRELLQSAMQRDKLEDCLKKFQSIGDNWTELLGQIEGPKDSPYEGGRFLLEIKLPAPYPSVPPQVRFITRIWHPNVSPVNGTICRDVCKDWTASIPIRTALLSLRALLYAAVPDKPQDATVCMQYKTSQEMFKMTAQHWTNAYANGPKQHAECYDKIKQLKDQGADVDKARLMLSKINWDVEEAEQLLF